MCVLCDGLTHEMTKSVIYYSKQLVQLICVIVLLYVQVWMVAYQSRKCHISLKNDLFNWILYVRTHAHSLGHYYPTIYKFWSNLTLNTIYVGIKFGIFSFYFRSCEAKFAHITNEPPPPAVQATEPTHFCLIYQFQIATNSVCVFFFLLFPPIGRGHSATST